VRRALRPYASPTAVFTHPDQITEPLHPQDKFYRRSVISAHGIARVWDQIRGFAAPNLAWSSQ